MQQLSFSNIANLTKKLDSDNAYWLVRTMGGDFYDEYINNGYIAIGYNEILLSHIEEAIKVGDAAQKLLSSRIKIIDKEEEVNESYAAAQLIKFHRDIKVGDTVIVPSRGSGKVKIGIVVSDVYTEKNTSNDKKACPFNKRREVKWGQQFLRGKLTPKLQLMFNSRHIISNVSDYSQYIDSLTNDFYEKDGQTFLILRVKQESEISGADITLISDLLGILDDYAKEYAIQVTPNDVKIKISVQSPGDIIMHALSAEGMAIMGMAILLIKGGNISYHKETGFNMGTNDILQSISEFLDRRRDRNFNEALQKKLENMEIESPEELTKMIESSKNKRKEY